MKKQLGGVREEAEDADNMIMRNDIPIDSDLYAELVISNNGPFVSNDNKRAEK